MIPLSQVRHTCVLKGNPHAAQRLALRAPESTCALKGRCSLSGNPHAAQQLALRALTQMKCFRLL